MNVDVDKIKKDSLVYEYNTSLVWTGEKKGISSSEGKPDLKIACPPEFGGHPNIWSSEDIFLASVEACTMTTFVHFAKMTELNLVSYNSKATGFVKMIDNSFYFDFIKLHIKIEVKTERDKKKVERIWKHMKKTCLISNSIKTNVEYHTEILVKG